MQTLAGDCPVVVVPVSFIRSASPRTVSSTRKRLFKLGHGKSTRWTLAALLLLVASSRCGAACVDPEKTAHVTVNITRYFNEIEEKSRPDLLGIQGTGWFASSGLMVTASHVAEAMHLSTTDWKDIELRDSESKRSVGVRVLRLVGNQSEKIAVLELKTPLPDVQFLRFRMEPLAANESVISLAFLDDRLRIAEGRFVEYGGHEKFTEAAMLELSNGNDRLVLDHGASGAPVLDCQGRVVAVVSHILTQTIRMVPSMRVSTPWGRANVVSIPIQTLTAAVE